MTIQWNKPQLGSKINTSLPLAKGLVAGWLFNEASGGFVRDITGNNHNGVFGHSTGTSYPRWMSFGRGGYSVQCLNPYAYINCGSDFIGVDDFSMSSLIFLNTIYGNGSYLLTNGSLRIFGFDATTKRLYVSGIPSGGAVYTSNGVLQLKRWYHVGVTVSSLGIVQAYLDGIQVIFSGVTTRQPATLNFLLCGKDNTNTYLGGYMDHCFVWNRLLTKQELSLLYTNPYRFIDDYKRYWFYPKSSASIPPHYLFRRTL